VPAAVVSGPVPTKGAAVAITVMNFEVDDYDTWKAIFDEDPAGRTQSGATVGCGLSSVGPAQ
jgi:hypothetical protein